MAKKARRELVSRRFLAFLSAGWVLGTIFVGLALAEDPTVWWRWLGAVIMLANALLTIERVVHYPVSRSMAPTAVRRPSPR